MKHGKPSTPKFQKLTPTGDLHHTPVETTMGLNCLANAYKS